MIKGHALLGLKVIGRQDGTDLGAVKDIIFDHDTDQVLALLLSDRDLFGLIDAQIVPWEQVDTIGGNAVVVASSHSKIKAGSDPQVRRIMDRDTALSGTRIFTTDGKDLGTMGDVFIDENTGRIEGYEVSGGFMADTLSGKRFVRASEDVELGRDVAFVPPEVVDELEEQRQNEPGGLQVVAASVGESVSGVYSSAAATVSDTYANIANASVEKQKEYVVGKTAAFDVIIGADKAAETTTGSLNLEPGEVAVIRAGGSPASTSSELLNPAQATATDVSSSGEVVQGEVLVRKGEVITAEHAERATAAGILHTLVAAATGGATSEATAGVRESAAGSLGAAGDTAGDWTDDMQQRAADAAIGKPASHTVTAHDGTVIVVEGEIITGERMELARLYDEENALIAAAGMGAAGQTASHAGEAVATSATNLWDTVKQKAAELTTAAQDKKAQLDQEAQQARINRALGRPATRVILDTQDNVILNTGDIITHKAVNHAREAGVLDVLLDSVYEADPDITPEMMRLESPGGDALPSQAQPTGGPITATVAPDQPAQDTPAQDRPAQGQPGGSPTTV